MQLTFERPSWHHPLLMTKFPGIARAAWRCRQRTLVLFTFCILFYLFFSFLVLEIAGQGV